MGVFFQLGGARCRLDSGSFGQCFQTSFFGSFDRPVGAFCNFELETKITANKWQNCCHEYSKTTLEVDPEVGDFFLVHFLGTLFKTKNFS